MVQNSGDYSFKMDRSALVYISNAEIVPPGEEIETLDPGSLESIEGRAFGISPPCPPDHVHVHGQDEETPLVPRPPVAQLQYHDDGSDTLTLLTEDRSLLLASSSPPPRENDGTRLQQRDETVNAGTCTGSNSSDETETTPPANVVVDDETTEPSVKSAFSDYAKHVEEIVTVAAIQVEAVQQQQNSSKQHELLFKQVCTEDQLNEWYEIKQGYEYLIGNVNKFSLDTIEKLRLVRRRVENEHFASLRDCYRGFEPSDASKRIEELSTQCVGLIKRLVAFEKGIKKHGEKYKKRLKCAIGAMVSAIGVAVLLFTGLMTTIPIAAEALYAITTLVSVLCSAAVVRTNATLVERTQKATAYLKNIEQNLQNLHASLEKVHANSKAFAAIGEEDYRSDREGIQNDIDRITAKLEELVALCSKAKRDEEEAQQGNQGWMCVIM